MGCPQCQSDEISPAGVCLICGYQTSAAEPSAAESKGSEEDSHGYSGMIEMDYAEGAPEAPDKNDTPRWRQELSQRLNEIKQKRESATVARLERRIPSAPAPPAKPVESLSVLQARLLERMPVRKPQAPSVPPPRQKTLEPVAPESAQKTMPQSTDPREVRNLIDNAVSKQLSPSALSGIAEISRYAEDGPVDQEGKLILLSRTLSGLVDLIVIVLCTGVFIIAADYFSGIIVLDHISLIDFSVLFLLNYFLYSLFFLCTSNQTIGMMITDLRVVGTGENRPSMGQVLRRCSGYLVSLFGLGIGLLLSLFDRENLCFHDRHSGTRVERI
jgi:uncharacterized RDD family membrane protein YckC